MRAARSAIAFCSVLDNAGIKCSLELRGFSGSGVAAVRYSGECGPRLEVACASRLADRVVRQSAQPLDFGAQPLERDTRNGSAAHVESLHNNATEHNMSAIFS